MCFLEETLEDGRAQNDGNMEELAAIPLRGMDTNEVHVIPAHLCLLRNY